MDEAFKVIWRTCTGWWQGVFRPAARALPAPRRSTNREHIRDVEESGQWYHLSDLLDRLEDYFSFIAQMKDGHKDAYQLYSRVGGYVIPRETYQRASGLEVNWKDPDLPAFGCIHIADTSHDDTGDKCSPEFMYFRKVHRPAHTQASNGVVYEFTIFYAGGRGGVKGVPLTCHVAIEGGTPKLLRERVSRRHNVKSGYFTSWSWAWPPAARVAAGEWNEPPEDAVPRALSWTINTVMSASAGMQVRVSKEKLSALFTIDMLQTPRIFRDRDMVVNENGRRKRIFHIVRGHKRRLAGGDVNVKTHFRGERKFNWGDYRVVISMPGLHHAHSVSFSAAGRDDSDPDEGYVSSKRLGKAIRGHETG